MVELPNDYGNLLHIVAPSIGFMPDFYVPSPVVCVYICMK